MVEETNIILAILLSCFAMFSMALLIVVFVVIQKRKASFRENEHDIELKNKELEIFKTLIVTQEQERERIARNLHDEVNPMISALKFIVQENEIKHGSNEKLNQDLLREKKFIDEILTRMRVIEQDLSPSYLLRNGLISALKSYLFELPGITVDVVDENCDSLSLSHEIAINIYRVFLELITNLLKHDNPENLNVVFFLTDLYFQVIIHHDGSGITNGQFVSFSETSNGMGMNSLKSRVTLLDAELDFQTKPSPTIRFQISI